jgi:hypothetical protein
MKRTRDEATSELVAGGDASSPHTALVVIPPSTLAPTPPPHLLSELWLGPILSPLLATYSVRTRIMLRRTSRWFRDNVSAAIDPEKDEAVFWKEMRLEVEGFTRDNILTSLAWRLNFNFFQSPRHDDYLKTLEIPLRLGRPDAFWMMLAAYQPFPLFDGENDLARDGLGQLLLVAACEAPEDRVIQTVEFMRRFSVPGSTFWNGWLVDDVLREVFLARRWILFQHLVIVHFDSFVDHLIKSQWWDDLQGHVEHCTEIFEKDGDPRWAQLYFPRLFRKKEFVAYFKPGQLLEVMRLTLDFCEHPELMKEIEYSAEDENEEKLE